MKHEKSPTLSITPRRNKKRILTERNDHQNNIQINEPAFHRSAIVTSIRRYIFVGYQSPEAQQISEARERGGNIARKDY